mgnify:CR=1 FL=1
MTGTTTVSTIGGTTWCCASSSASARRVVPVCRASGCDGATATTQSMAPSTRVRKSLLMRIAWYWTVVTLGAVLMMAYMNREALDLAVRALAGRGVDLSSAVLVHGGCWTSKFGGITQLRNMAGALAASPPDRRRPMFSIFGKRSAGAPASGAGAGAPPAAHVQDLVKLAQAAGWEVAYDGMSLELGG